MSQQTPLFSDHQRLHGQLVDFAGWMLPIHYGSQLKEHEYVRHDAGIFDVSHMTIVDVTGPDAEAWLRFLLANDVKKLKAAGRALYTCMLNKAGGIIDDLIVYRRAEGYRLVLNAATRTKDLAWLKQSLGHFQVSLHERNDLAILALQGPRVREKLAALLPAEAQALTSFQFIEFEGTLLACTGYTGERGYEWIVPSNRASELFQKCIALGLHPCGLGARDTLRLEAGLNLYGQDMTEETTPWESQLAWTVSLTDPDRAFIGRDALISQQKSGITQALVGLILTERGVLRAGQEVYLGEQKVGVTTSGTFSPSLNQGIAMARVLKGIPGPLDVLVRQKRLSVEVVTLPFIKQGQPVFRAIQEVTT